VLPNAGEQFGAYPAESIGSLAHFQHKSNRCVDVNDAGTKLPILDRMMHGIFLSDGVKAIKYSPRYSVLIWAITLHSLQPWNILSIPFAACYDDSPSFLLLSNAKLTTEVAWEYYKSENENYFVMLFVLKRDPPEPQTCNAFSLLLQVSGEAPFFSLHKRLRRG
jgi:hypothetical protein